MQKQRILVVEDDLSFREVFERAIGHALAAEMLDVAFVGVGSISEARALLREGGLDAALIDVRLPDGDGLDLVEEINDGGVGSPMPTLVLRAYLDHKVAARAMDAGAQGAFSKVAPVPETVEGVEAEVHLVARLKNVRAILVKALDTIGEHPEILRILARSLTRVVRETLEGTLSTLDSVLEGLEVGDTVDEALLGTLGEVRTALEDVLERTDRAVEEAAQEALGEGPAGEAPAAP